MNAGPNGVPASPKVEFSGHAVEVQTDDVVEVENRVANPDVPQPFTDGAVQGRFGSERGTPVAVIGFGPIGNVHSELIERSRRR